MAGTEAWVRDLARVCHAVLRPRGFVRSGRRNLWTRCDEPEVVQAVGFYGTWHGGFRNVEWGLWLPDVERLMFARPAKELVDVARCGLRGKVAVVREGQPLTEEELADGVGVLDGMRTPAEIAAYLGRHEDRDFVAARVAHFRAALAVVLKDPRAVELVDEVERRSRHWSTDEMVLRLRTAVST